MAAANIYWHDYRYFPYERDIAYKEVVGLLDPPEIKNKKDGFQLLGRFNNSDISKLVYFSHYEINNQKHPTLQYLFEKKNNGNGKKRQSTRYSSHDLHEYKGRFNPQIVRSILNILGIDRKAKILDPFCGCGTTLVECAHVDISAVGCDINPLAIFIANAKVKALGIRTRKLKEEGDVVFDKFYSDRRRKVVSNMDDRLRYLSQWFPPDELNDIELLRKIILSHSSVGKEILLSIVSNLLRDYSLQEPADLRIRRRKSPFPAVALIDVFREDLYSFCASLEQVQEAIGVKRSKNKAYHCEAQEIGKRFRRWGTGSFFDAVITSPPYATALPYIDTQRLSLIWLGLCDVNDLRRYEANLTGSREFMGAQKKSCAYDFNNNLADLPKTLYSFLLKLENAVSDDDGFRRRDLPILLYRYFSNMKNIFYSVAKVVKPKGAFVLIVGHNKTYLGGMKYDINTPVLLKELARESGWIIDFSYPLQTYQRYSIHMENAVSSEDMICLRRK
ncbi:MAG: DNA methyltransferase [Candidatus Omnitrophica bacterium]|nr:DNA methyltransferase [Candidatus Omnitrophota bacterium]